MQVESYSIIMVLQYCRTTKAILPGYNTTLKTLKRIKDIRDSSNNGQHEADERFNDVIPYVSV